MRRRGVCRRVEEDEIGSRCGEHRSRLSSRLRGVDQARRDNLGAERLEPRLDAPLVPLEPIAQPLELRPVGSEADPEDADLSLPLRMRRGGAVPARLRAPQPRARAPVDVPRVRDDHAREQQAADDDVLVLGGHEVRVSAV